MGLNCGGHAECSDHQRDQTHERKESGGLAKALFDQRMRLAVIGDQRVAKNFVQILANGGDLQVRRHAEEISLGGAAACDQQTSAFDGGPRHHHTRTDVEAAGHAVRLIGDFGADAKWLSANADGIADVRIETQQHAVRNRKGIRLQRGLDIHRWIEGYRAVERIDGRVHRFNGNQHRGVAGGRQRHGQRFCIWVRSMPCFARAFISSVCAVVAV